MTDVNERELEEVAGGNLSRSKHEFEVDDWVMTMRPDLEHGYRVTNILESIEGKRSDGTQYEVTEYRYDKHFDQHMKKIHVVRKIVTPGGFLFESFEPIWWDERLVE